MRKKLTTAAVALAACLVTGTAYAEDTVYIYNWADYFAEDTLSGFTEKSGIKTRLDLFDTLDLLETKLLTGGTGYDVVYPSASVGERAIIAGALQEIDASKLPNYKNLDPELLELIAQHDPGNKHLVPYTWLTTGIAYNIKAVAERMPDAPVGSLDMFFKPEIAANFADCGIGIVDVPTEVIPITLNYLGLDPYSTDKSDLAKAQELLLAFRPHIRHMQSGQLISDMASGELCLALMWSGDAGIAAARAEEAGTGIEVAYSIPKEGTVISFDTMAIPTDAKSPDLALKFINYILEPEVIAQISNYLFYANPNTAATPLLDESVRTDPNIYPPEDVRAHLFIDKTLPQRANRARTRVWTRFRSGG